MFLRNVWYVAAMMAEVTRAPLGRILLNEPVVLYRKQDGAPVALEDRCCHRRAPLHIGQVIDDGIRCGYHGFVFDADGACTHMPGYERPSANARVRSYPVCERHGWIWIWMGDPAQADEGTVPDFHWNDDPHWATTGARIPVRANYLLLVENLLDLSHVQFVHASTIGSDDSDAKLEFERGDDFVRVTRRAAGIVTPPLYAKQGFGAACDQSKIIAFTPAANITIDITTSDSGAGASGKSLHIMVLNAITPETDGTCHYFWASARDFDIANDQVTQLFHKGTMEAFTEDKDVLEKQQACIDLDPAAPTINIPSDAGGVNARRLVDRLLAEESAAHAVAAQ